MKKRFPQSREAFSYFQNFAFDAARHCFNRFFTVEGLDNVIQRIL